MITLAALPIVGAGSAYRRRGIPLLHEGRTLPSGGMVYQGLNLWKDLAAGWLQQSLAQLRVAWREGRRFDLVVSVGDHVPLIFALLTGRPTVVFLVSTSSFYEGRLRLSALTRWGCRRRRVRVVLTRDAFTARDLQAQGLGKARFRGYPIMDLPSPRPAPGGPAGEHPHPGPGARQPFPGGAAQPGADAQALQPSGPPGRRWSLALPRRPGGEPPLAGAGTAGRRRRLAAG